MVTEIEAAGLTDVGRTREHNEDFFLSDPELGLHVVCDGMGGHASGEIASRQTAEVVREEVARDPRFASDDPAGWEEGLREAIVAANRVVHGSSGTDRRKRGMGTTCTVLLLRGSRAVLAHVGDSRLYLAREEQVHQLSHDHTFVGRGLAGRRHHRRAGGEQSPWQRADPRGGSSSDGTRRYAALRRPPGRYAAALQRWAAQLHRSRRPRDPRRARGRALRWIPEPPRRPGERARWRGQHHGPRRAHGDGRRPAKEHRVSQKIADLATLRRIHLLCELSMRELSQICACLRSHVFAPGAPIRRAGGRDRRALRDRRRRGRGAPRRREARVPRRGRALWGDGAPEPASAERHGPGARPLPHFCSSHGKRFIARCSTTTS